MSPTPGPFSVGGRLSFFTVVLGQGDCLPEKAPRRTLLTVAEREDTDEGQVISERQRVWRRTPPSNSTQLPTTPPSHPFHPRTAATSHPPFAISRLGYSSSPVRSSSVRYRNYPLFLFSPLLPGPLVLSWGFRFRKRESRALLVRRRKRRRYHDRQGVGGLLRWLLRSRSEIPRQISCAT